MKSVHVKSALRNGRSSAHVRVKLVSEPAQRFHALLRSTGISSESAASTLLSAALMESSEVSRLIAKSPEQSGDDLDLQGMTFDQLRHSYREHLITKESLEAYLAELLKKYSGRLGLIAAKEFHLKHLRAKRSF